MLDTQIGYWRDQLAGVEPVLELPTDRPRPVERTPHGAVERAVFPMALRERLKAVSRDASHAFHDAAGDVCGLARRYTGRDDIVVGSQRQGARDVDVENLIGFFVHARAAHHLTGDRFRDC